MRVLIVEDEVVFLENLKYFLKKIGYAVDTVQNIADASEYVYINTYDLILLDVNLPDGNGFDFCLYIRETEKSHTPIIMITARDEIKDRILGLDNGADDYIIKPFDFDELRARIQAVFRRVQNRTTNKMKIGDIEIIPSEFKVLISDQAITLNPKEYEIIYHLFMSYPNPQSLEQIIEHAWDEYANPFSNSARVYLTSVRKKITTHSKQVSLKNKVKVGYYLCIH